MFHINLSDNSCFSCNETETIIEAALRNNVYLDHSCLSGRCSSCKFKLISGSTRTDQDEISLSDQEKQENYILTCVRKAKSDIYLDAEDLGKYGLSKTQTIPAKVKKITQLTEGIKEITLRVPPNQKVNFLEGQYINVLCKGIKRSYSIASTSTQSDIQLIIKNFPNGKMSQYWFNESKVDDLLRIEIPKGTFFLRNHPNKENIIFLATGTGIAPVKSIIESASNQQKLSEYSRIIILWGLKYKHELFWKPESIKVEFRPIFSRETENKNYVQNNLDKIGRAHV